MEMYQKRRKLMKVGISACSNGHLPEWRNQISELEKVLKDMNIETVISPHIMRTVDEYSGTDKERAEDLMRFYTDDEIDAIYDISGGDLANGVLKYLDYDTIAKADKTFWGYSDLTTVINAIYTMTGKPGVLYQVKNMVWSCADKQRKRFSDYIAEKNNDLFDIDYSFLQGNSMKGVIVGGNVRCFAKLAGTRYWPDMNGKILLLESLGGESGQIGTLFNQLDDIGVFDMVSGVLLGTFTNYEKAGLTLSVYDLLKTHISDVLPVACTRDIGHGHDAKAIIIGKEYFLSKA
jgi:muramoyltetrapeptide carboxypeptidase LdcA involved in peptidoglycan recycling